MNQVAVKLLLALASLVVTFVICIFPTKLINLSRLCCKNVNCFGLTYSRSLSLMNCFAGGVFVATGFLHMIPETSLHYAQISVLGYMPDFRPESNQTSAQVSKHQVDYPGSSSPALGKKAIDYISENRFPIAEFVIVMGMFAVYLIEALVTMCHFYVKERQKAFDSEISPLAASASAESIKALNVPANESGLIDVVTLILALSLHSVIEGLAIGIAISVESLLLRFASVMMHKVVIALTTGVAVAEKAGIGTGGFWVVVGLLFIFSVSSPIGIVIGAILTGGEAMDGGLSFGGQQMIVVLEGLASGTFVYIAFFEVLGEEHHKEKAMMFPRFLAAFVGSLLIAVLIYVTHTQLQ